MSRRLVLAGVGVMRGASLGRRQATSILTWLTALMFGWMSLPPGVHSQGEVDSASAKQPPNRAFDFPKLARHTRDDILELVEGLSQIDAEFTLVLGQARLLRMKKPIVQPEDDGEATISVADPTVLDLQPLADGRSLRLLGLRPGSTEFTLTLGDDSHY
ncbi:MAG: pilus assembly protein N-terminal domain-containing protein, partial [Planctomycetaceae bacterium]